MGTMLTKYPDLIKPSFWFWGTFQGSCDTRCYSRLAQGDVEVLTHSNSFYAVFWSHERTDRITTDSGITTSATTWHFFSFFSLSALSAHSETFFLYYLQFLIPTTKKNAAHRIMESPHHSDTLSKACFLPSMQFAVIWLHKQKRKCFWGGQKMDTEKCL